ncbi:MAG TPA: polymer-forming cytoskeletal protein [Steroidobacteraceae bacterium]|nr:polymer-forming cytoskeletal protein [Steroidobacteraceae bacterium]
MALWKEPVGPATNPAPPKDPVQREPAVAPVTPMTQDVPRRPRERADAKESIIAADITIEGKIEGSGHVRIAGSFKGDVHVQGNLTIEPGARVTGQVRAHTVTVGGELQGNIDAAARVELLETGIVAGDVKAGSLTVAAGSRMRGQVEFGWEDKAPARSFAGSKVDLAAS